MIKMEQITWLYRILIWIAPLIISPVISYIITVQQMKKRYENDHKAKMNDLQIQNLIELNEMLSKLMTTSSYIKTLHISFFNKILDNSIEAIDENWNNHQKSILENEKAKINYIPKIRSKLLLLPEFKENFKNKVEDVEGRRDDYIDFYINITYKKPQKLFDKGKEERLEKIDVLNYYMYSETYSILIEHLFELTEKEIEDLVNNKKRHYKNSSLK